MDDRSSKGKSPQDVSQQPRCAALSESDELWVAGFAAIKARSSGLVSAQASAQMK
jgi:hypothetical protein